VATQSTRESVPFAVGVDLAGKMYAAGYGVDSAGKYHGVIRTNADGSWSTADDYNGADAGVSDPAYLSFATDPTTGALYAGGTSYWNTGSFIRTAAGPAPSATAMTTFSSVAISAGTGSTLLGGDLLGLSNTSGSLLA
jgi:hypothetical protein